MTNGVWLWWEYHGTTAVASAEISGNVLSYVPSSVVACVIGYVFFECNDVKYRIVRVIAHTLNRLSKLDYNSTNEKIFSAQNGGVGEISSIAARNRTMLLLLGVGALFATEFIDL